MSASLRIGSFAAVLAALFAAAVLLGGAVDPDVDVKDNEHEGASDMTTMATPGDEAGHADEGGHAGDTSAPAPGLAVASGGLRLVAERSSLPAAPAADFSFRILGSDGEAVTAFDTEHERDMHLIAVRRDFTGFQHLHPRMAPDGTWSAPIDTSRPGTYRVFADFSTGGESMTLGTDLEVAGDFRPDPLPTPAATASAGGGYEVRVDAGHPHAGEEARTEFTIARDGERLAGVEPYLGAAGHLVALRAGDLAFLHTHPIGTPDDADPIAFDVAYPSAGSYRLFLQFRHAGAVRTAAFTVEVEESHG
ncbi:MAG TPA: hypothetical protein VFH44_05005 [Solirubrobacterales bacterium]|nr:hypothetical protein [Solirubrobacterales bacterium]